MFPVDLNIFYLTPTSSPRWPLDTVACIIVAISPQHVKTYRRKLRNWLSYSRVRLCQLHSCGRAFRLFVMTQICVRYHNYYVFHKLRFNWALITCWVNVYQLLCIYLLLWPQFIRMSQDNRLKHKKSLNIFFQKIFEILYKSLSKSSKIPMILDGERYLNNDSQSH